MSRRFFVGGNYKMNGLKDSLFKLIEGLNTAKLPTDKVDVCVAPTALHLLSVQGMLDKKIHLAAQNCYHKPSGAFTGEISATQLVDQGINWVILGHSERRHVFHESEETLGLKLRHALDEGMNVIYCIGEQLEERKSEQTMSVVSKQCENLFNGLKADEWSRIVVAYEPVWAIGTGLTASPAQAQDVHAQVRDLIKTKVSADVALATRIIYGGSVKPANCEELASQSAIDGFLVGGASLKAEDFTAIVNSYTKST